MKFEVGQHIHLVGIGGFGMSGIARILLERGFVVSGSDRNENDLTRALLRDGATVYHGHAAEYVDDADMVLISSAIPPDHVEVIAAQGSGIPVYKRRDILADLMPGHQVIAVAGTHGKTTTTSMVVHILQQAELDPSYIVGGIMATTHTNAAVGSSNIFVIEADEYDHMFLGLQPDIIVLTSLEYDHPDFFESWASMRDAFNQFIDLLPETGVLIVCGDDAGADQLLREQKQIAYKRAAEGLSFRTIISYGIDFLDFVDVMASQQEFDQQGSTVFDVGIEGKLYANLSRVHLPLPGKHNIQNAVAALIAANQMRVSFEEGAHALASFKTTGRRFDVRGMARGVTVIDDYAHHPTAIRHTLDATRTRFPEAEIWAVWQPHMYSRTQKLLADYVEAFVSADHVLVTEIYAAREAPINGVNGASVAALIEHEDARFVADFEMATELLLDEVKAPAVIVIMSAGDAPQIGQMYLQEAKG